MAWPFSNPGPSRGRGQRSYTRLRSFASELPWAGMIAPGVVLNKAGTLMSTWRLHPKDLEIAETAERIALSGIAHRAIQDLGSDVCLHIDVIRRPGRAYSRRDPFPDPATALLDEERREMFEDETSALVTESFLTLTWAPPSRAQSLFSKWFVTGPRYAETADRDLEAFEREAEKLVGGLSSVLRPERLGSEEFAGYLRQCLIEVPGEVRLPEVPFYLDAYLSIPEVERGYDPIVDDDHTRILSLDHDGLPARSEPALFRFLMGLPVAYRWTLRWLPLSRKDAQREANRAERQWFRERKGFLGRLAKPKETSDPEPDRIARGALAMAEDASKVTSLVYSGRVGGGFVSSSFIVRDPDPKRAEAMAAAVQKTMISQGFSARRETDGSYEVWLGSLPGNTTENIRKMFVHSVNTAHFLPLHQPYEGEFETDSRYLEGAPPLCWVLTDGSTPYRGALHLGSVAHAIVAGPTGSGKSVFLGFLAASWLRYANAQVFYFDRGVSQFALCQATGGAFYRLGADAEREFGGTSPSFTPLAWIDDRAELEWAKGWIETLVEDATGELVSERQRTWIAEGLSMLAAAPRETRTMTSLIPLVQDDLLRRVLSRYSLPHDESSASVAARLLDSTTDSLVRSHFHYFEIGDLLGMSPALVNPILHYLFHRIERALSRDRPSLIILDEAWQAFAYGAPQGETGIFAAKLIEWARTLRRKNAALVLTTQNLSDLRMTQSVEAMGDNFPTRILLPNPKALDGRTAEEYASAGLTTKQRTLVAEARTASDRTVEVTSGQRAVSETEYYWMNRRGARRVRLALGEVGLALLTAEPHNDRIAELVAEYGPEWFGVWLEERGSREWAKRFRDAREATAGEVERGRQRG